MRGRGANQYWQLLAALSLVVANAGAQECGSLLGTELTQRAANDQAARNALIASPGNKDLHAAAVRVDAENTAYMRQVLAKCGWPRRSVVGSEAAKAAWLLTQHADMDPDYQAAASRAMTSAVYAKEADPVALASLVDRNRRLTHQPQVYGFQYNVDAAGAIEFLDIVHPGMLDNRRKDIGLAPFFCLATRLSRERKNATVRWPAGVPFKYADCSGDPEAGPASGNDSTVAKKSP